MKGDGWEIIAGDCADVLAAMPAASVDAIVTDPPYGLEFMGKDWDSFRVGERSARWTGERSGARCQACGKRDAFRNPHDCGDAADWIAEPVDPDTAPPAMLAFQAWVTVWAREARRVLKPGGHLLAFGGTRTYHRLASAIEDAGFEIRDSVLWLYGSGFPKSLDVSKAIDRAAGFEREVVAREATRFTSTGRNERYGKLDYFDTDADGYEVRETTRPASPAAERWEGWGTALKPGHEPIVVARKPLEGTVIANVQRYGTGALNIDGCRIAGPMDGSWGGRQETGIGYSGNEPDGYRTQQHEAGRFPANVALDPDAARELDAQSGDVGGGFGVRGAGERSGAAVGYGDAGGASRFFYCAKANRAERNAGLEAGDDDRPVFGDDGETYRGLSNSKLPQANAHPTVKPIELMRWLVRLATPPGGVVVDPVTGSGTTGIAAVLEGFRFVGIEREPDYIGLAAARVGWWQKHAGEGTTAEVLAAGEARHAIETTGQASLFDGDDEQEA